MMIRNCSTNFIYVWGPMYGNFGLFQDYTVFKGYTGSPFVGLKHFQRLFSDPLF